MVKAKRMDEWPQKDREAYRKFGSGWNEYQQKLFIFRADWTTDMWKRHNENIKNGLVPEGSWCKQLPPPDCRSIWFLKTGRGFGKTMAASGHWLYRGLKTPKLRILVGAPTFTMLRNVCFEGDSGLVNVLRDRGMEEYMVNWNRSLGELTLTNGTVFQGLTGETPDKLRGYQFHGGWLDEYAAFEKPEEYMEQVNYTIRLESDESPVLVITTTPKPSRAVRDLIARSRPYPPRADEDVDPTDFLVPKEAKSLSSLKNPIFNCAVTFEGGPAPSSTVFGNGIVTR